MKKYLIILIFFVAAVSAQTVKAQHQHHQPQELKAGDIKPGHSFYHLNAEFTNHKGKAIELSLFEGKPVIVVMFYGNCTEVCPILIRDTWRVYRSLNESQRKDVRVLAVSFDTENDDSETLNAYAKYEQLDLTGWHFLTGNDNDIRALAMMLGVKYRKKSNGHYAHSNLITALDKEGKFAARIEGLNQPVETMKKIIENM